MRLAPAHAEYVGEQVRAETIGPLAVPIERPRTDSDHDRPARGL
jgi:hypothetical protein